MCVEPFGVANVVTKAYEGIRGHFSNSGRGTHLGGHPQRAPVSVRSGRSFSPSLSLLSWENPTALELVSSNFLCLRLLGLYEGEEDASEAPGVASREVSKERTSIAHS